MRGRKHTAWRKNRKFGDVHGGRVKPKIKGGILRPLHSLRPPGPGRETPIQLVDKPPPDHFFPLTVAECLEVIAELPKRDQEGLTHLWLRRPRGQAARKGCWPLAQFICGSGVRLVAIYPWHEDRRLYFGRKKPRGKRIEEYLRFGASLVCERGWWCVEFGPAELRRYCIHLLYHEMGHHVDQHRGRWSCANRKQTEEVADQYAVGFLKTGAHVFHRIEERRVDQE